MLIKVNFPKCWIKTKLNAKRKEKLLKIGP